MPLPACPTYSDSQVDTQFGCAYCYHTRFGSTVTCQVNGWASRDSIGERGGNNLYGFVRNSSICFIDWKGLLRRPNLSDMQDFLDVWDEGTELAGLIADEAETAGLLYEAVASQNKEALEDLIKKYGMKALKMVARKAGMGDWAVTGIIKGTEFGTELGNMIATAITRIYDDIGCQRCYCENVNGDYRGEEYTATTPGGNEFTCFVNNDEEYFVKKLGEPTTDDDFVDNLFEIFAKPTEMWRYCDQF